jgi:hypothetical protein
VVGEFEIFASCMRILDAWGLDNQEFTVHCLCWALAGTKKIFSKYGSSLCVCS